MSENVALLNLPAALGSMGIMANHAPLMTTLEIGTIKYVQDGRDHFLAVHGGFAEVKDNVVIVLADAAEKAEDIDLARAEASQQRAQDRLANRTAELDVLRAELSLRRAIARIKTSQKA